jgi:hypothetical protein
MEGWSPHERGGHAGSQVVEAAEHPPELGDASPCDALPNAGVDAGRKSVPAAGVVSLDVLLYGRRFKACFRSSSGYGVRSGRFR